MKKVTSLDAASPAQVAEPKTSWVRVAVEALPAPANRKRAQRLWARFQPLSRG